MPSQSQFLEVVLPDPNEAGKVVATATGISDLARSIGKVYTLDVTALGSPYTLPYSATEGGDKTGLHFVVLKVIGTPPGTFIINVPDKSHWFILDNQTAQSVEVKTSAGTGPTILAGQNQHCYCDATDVIGLEGIIGSDGATAGFQFVFSTSTADADPGGGVFRLNNATLASVTEAYVDNANNDAADISAWLDTFDDSTNPVRGMLYIRGITTQTDFAAYNVSGSVVDGTGYRKITLAHIASSGPFGNAETYLIDFVRAGNVGATTIANTVSYEYDSTTADADPGSGKFRLNNATIASVTEGYFDNNEFAGAAVSAWLDTFDDSTATIRGTLVLRNLTSTSAFAIFNVTGSVVDGTGYRKLTLAHVASGGTFTTLDLVGVSFHRAGDAPTDLDTLSDVAAPTPAAGDALVFDGTDWINRGFRGAMVKKSVDQTLASYTVAAAMTFDAETYDVGAWHDNAVNNTRLTVPAGVSRVRLHGKVQCSLVTSGNWTYLGIYKNGSIVYDGSTEVHNELNLTVTTGIVNSPVLEVVPGDWFELYLQMEADTSITVVALRSWFAIEAVS